MKLEKTTEFVVVSGWVLMMVCLFSIIGLAMYLVADEAFVKDMAKVAIGFVFGSLPPLLSNLLLQKANQLNTPAPTPTPTLPPSPTPPKT